MTDPSVAVYSNILARAMVFWTSRLAWVRVPSEECGARWGIYISRGEVGQLASE